MCAILKWISSIFRKIFSYIMKPKVGKPGSEDISSRLKKLEEQTDLVIQLLLQYIEVPPSVLGQGNTQNNDITSTEGPAILCDTDDGAIFISPMDSDSTIERGFDTLGVTDVVESDAESKINKLKDILRR